ncbi:LysR family transcriptional regulator [Saccharopolyspora sp. K220]|uniref:LysR family transcriptional regulator n=1 Tax=Saccharopolyspora soli TaxID=2926618 RepID=UPI001F59C5C5|nr:LysR family transcriptional regulator [Saccharopolyspora soli]MCI2422517.1 LysR family transcriptional regulator [Saccharopolyspora soli]
MERRQLEYFVAIVDHGGYNKAAQELNVAQPSMSRAISNLERELGVALFHRVGRNVTLSSAGALLVEEARLVLRGFGAMQATARSIANGATGQVDVAVTSSSALEPVTSVVATLRDQYPGIVVSTTPAVSAAEVVAMVRSGVCEVGICGHNTNPAGKGIVAHHLRDEEILLVLPPGEPLPADPRVTHDALRGRAFVVSKPSTAVRALFDRLAATVGGMTIAAEVGDRSAILPLVLRGVGAALMPDSWTDLARRSGADLRLLSPPELVPQWLVHRDGPTTPAGRVFIDRTLADHE